MLLARIRGRVGVAACSVNHDERDLIFPPFPSTVLENFNIFLSDEIFAALRQNSIPIKINA